jgi:predicted RNA-binding Zn-ribbon protein involved in translation (DUF1610 family)
MARASHHPSPEVDAMTSDACPACGHATLHCHEGFLEQGRNAVRSALVWTCPSCGWQRYEAAPVSRADPMGSAPRVWLN